MTESGDRPPLPPPPQVVKRRRRIYTVSFLIAVVGAVGGLATLVVAMEPDSAYISGRPWLVVLTPTRIGIEFITYGGDYTTVLYGIVDPDGNWVSWPAPIAPRFNIHVFPWDATTVADPAGRVHVAWTLFDSEQSVQTFHYVQLDPEGRIRVQVGPLGSAPVNSKAFEAPVPPGLLVTDQEVQVFWQQAGAYVKTTLDLSGRVTATPAAVPSVDSAAYPSRVEFEGRTARDSWASAGTDGGGNTFLVWQSPVYRGFGYNLFREYDLQFRRVGSRDVVEKTLYSTFGWWWTTKAAVLPAFIVFLVGLVASPILGARRRDWAAPRTGAKAKRSLRSHVGR